MALVAAVLSTLAACLALGMAASRWWKYRGARIIICPENHRPAGVRVDAAHAAVQTSLRLSHCSRWPERAGCGQQCLNQIEASPEDCLVRNILVRWYHGKRCALCGESFGDISLGGAKPAILSADKVSVEWSAIPAEQLPETLAAAQPICFACHMGDLLLRTHPELALDRGRPVERSRAE